ncbi:MAG: tRNA dihydrouridine synthase DusB [Oscillospiraceae bacterium]|nr:tRNA dihydrouridine synthase DusB [Oscillospiraceae bacterium]
MNISEIFKNTPLALAPMAGVTDAAFRAVCRDCGADVTYTEMVSSRALVYQDSKTNCLLTRNDGETPFAVQLFGNDPIVMRRAAEIALERTDADFIDINMGCPTPKIVNNGDGSALMKNIPLACEIVREIKRGVNVPVTVKFRKGWDGGSVNAVEFARAIEDAGADAITVHGRTRVAMYSGRADWDIIRDVVNSVSIPVFANGDVFEAADAVKIRKWTGAAGIMIGRASFGNPWIFTQCRAALDGKEIPALPPLSERLDVAERQIIMSAEHLGEHVALLEARRHIAWYLRGVRGGNAYKIRVTSMSTLEELHRLIEEIKHNLA